MRVNLIPPTIAEDEKSPLVEQLVAFIEQQSTIIEQQAEQIQQLKDEIARLKDHPRKPDIKPSSLGKKKKREKTKGSPIKGFVKRKNTPLLKKIYFF